MLAALLLTIASLLVLQVRYILEFVYNGQKVEIEDSETITAMLARTFGGYSSEG